MRHDEDFQRGWEGGRSKIALYLATPTITCPPPPPQEYIFMLWDQFWCDLGREKINMQYNWHFRREAARGVLGGLFFVLGYVYIASLKKIELLPPMRGLIPLLPYIAMQCQLNWPELPLGMALDGFEKTFMNIIYWIHSYDIIHSWPEPSCLLHTSQN